MTDQATSYTAELIARGLVVLSKEKELAGLVSPEVVEANVSLIKQFKKRPKFLAYVEHDWYRNLLKLKENILQPGTLLHIALRKRTIEEEVLKALTAEAISQVVVLGAGNDTLSFRLHKAWPQVRFIEIDRPFGQGLKIAGLKEKGLQENLKFLAADFNEKDLQTLLLSSEVYDPNCKTLFLAEGLFMFLAPEEILKTFSFAKNHAAPGSKFLFSFYERESMIKGRPLHSLIIGKLLLTLKGEKVRWMIKCEELPQFLSQVGLKVEKILTTKEQRTKYLGLKGQSRKIAEGEFLCLAQS